jgi:hypothetical protein
MMSPECAWQDLSREEAKSVWDRFYRRFQWYAYLLSV